MLKQSDRDWLNSLPGRHILFEDTPVSFVGRNGTGTAIGIYVSSVNGAVRLQPITAEARIAQTDTPIPEAQVRALITLLEPLGQRLR